MKVQPTAPSYSGEVTVSLGGQARKLNFGLNTLRDYSKLTGSKAGQFGQDLADDYNEALINLVFCALKRYVPADELPDTFGVDEAAEWIDVMSDADASLLADTIIQSIRRHNPLTQALLARATPTAEAPTATGGEN